MSETAEETQDEQVEREIAEEMGDEATPGLDPEPDEEPEPEPEAVAPQGGPMDDPAVWDKAGKSAETWRRRVGDLFAEDAVHLEVCPLCPDNLPGFIIPQAIPDELVDAVIARLRGTNLPERLQDPKAELCDVCNGHGVTLTGSMVPGNDTKPCEKCGARGWTNPIDRQNWQTMNPAETTTSPAWTPPPSSVSTFDGMPASDTWGRPVGNANYGRDPQYMTPAEREADPWARGL